MADERPQERMWTCQDCGTRWIGGPETPHGEGVQREGCPECGSIATSGPYRLLSTPRPQVEGERIERIRKALEKIEALTAPERDEATDPETVAEVWRVARAARTQERDDG